MSGRGRTSTGSWPRTFLVEGVAAYTIVEFNPNQAANDVRGLLAGRDVTI